MRHRAPASLARPAVEDAAERRQLTVMFCDLVGSTALVGAARPRGHCGEVIRAYQDACSGVVARYDGFVAKFMGDGILAYFGFPRAHEDDAERAVRAGLEIAAASSTSLETRGTKATRGPHRHRHRPRRGRRSRRRRRGAGAGRRRRHAQSRRAPAGSRRARAASSSPARRAGCSAIGSGCATLAGTWSRASPSRSRPGRSKASPSTESRFEAAHAARLTDLVGREAESAAVARAPARGVAGRRPDRADLRRGGHRQVAACRPGSPSEVADEPHTRLRYQCSPYHRDSALYPFVAAIGTRGADFAAHDEPPRRKLDKLEAVLAPATHRRRSRR